MDFKRDEAVRNQSQDELAESITPENWSIWKSRLATAASVKSNDLATLPPYERFLSAIAARQPKLVFELLEDRSILPNWTIHPIACALLDGEIRVEVEALLGRWLDDGHFVSEIAGLVSSASGVPPALLTKVASRAVNDADVRACTILVNGAISRYADNPQLWRDDDLLPVSRGSTQEPPVTTGSFTLGTNPGKGPFSETCEMTRAKLFWQRWSG